MFQYEGFGYTLDTDDIAAGPIDSWYKILESMEDKMMAQLELARKLRGVDVEDVAHRVISKHFLPDLIGNLKSFSGQKVRCTKCNESYRRVPLAGMCKCGNRLTLTVYEASVRKYLKVTKRIGKYYGISNYTQQRVEQIEASIASLFGNTGPIDEDVEDAPRNLESFCLGGEEAESLEACVEAEEEEDEARPKVKPAPAVIREKPLQAPKKEKRAAMSLDDF
jgi:DNA polymerase II large subunit